MDAQPQIFITGATGYLGGEVLYQLLQAYPSWATTTTCLIRTPSRGAELLATYPTVKTVIGTLDDSALIEALVEQADIVLNFASCDHLANAEAISRGMQRGKGGYLIHTSGTDILLPIKPHEPSKQTYDDWEGIRECLSIPEYHHHGPVDAVLRSIQKIAPRVKTAIVCPPTIIGLGRGTSAVRSIQIPALARLTIKHGTGIILPTSFADQKYCWQNVHVRDVANLYIELIKEAAGLGISKDPSRTWNLFGYYFANHLSHNWQQVCDLIAQAAIKQGVIQRIEPESLPDQDLKSVGPALWNDGIACKAMRAEKMFGWKPKLGGWEDEISDVVRAESLKIKVVPKQHLEE